MAPRAAGSGGVCLANSNICVSTFASILGVCVSAAIINRGCGTSASIFNTVLNRFNLFSRLSSGGLARLAGTILAGVIVSLANTDQKNFSFAGNIFLGVLVSPAAAMGKASLFVGLGVIS